MLDTVYHGALGFIPNVKALTLHCTLYDRVGWTALSTHRPFFICKGLLGLRPFYLQTFIKQISMGSYRLRSQDLLLLLVPKVRSELGKRVFMFAVPSVWNQLQNRRRLQEPVTSDSLKVIVVFAGLAPRGEVRCVSVGCRATRPAGRVWQKHPGANHCHVLLSGTTGTQTVTWSNYL